MDLELIKSYLEANKDDEQIKETLKGFIPETKTELTLDEVKRFVNDNEDAKKFLQSEKDAHFNKGLETWKSNNLSKVLDEEIKKRYPQETEESRKIKELEIKIQESERKAQMAELKVFAKDYAKEKNLPFELVDFFLGSDVEETKTHMEKLEKVFNASLEAAVKKQLGQEGYTPQNPNNETFTSEDVLKMSEEELSRNWEKVKHLLK